jgi:hypothetical protein
LSSPRSSSSVTNTSPVSPAINKPSSWRYPKPCAMKPSSAVSLTAPY